MTPSVDKFAYLSLFDPFTLAVLNDTGWYSVDISAADPYIWGKGKGCEFSMHSDPSLTCSLDQVGCHYLHMDKSVCSSIPAAGYLQAHTCWGKSSLGTVAVSWPESPLNPRMELKGEIRFFLTVFGIAAKMAGLKWTLEQTGFLVPLARPKSLTCPLCLEPSSVLKLAPSVAHLNCSCHIYLKLRLL